MEVLFAPDWRDGVPYQRLLAEALVPHGVAVNFLRDYKRILPLARLLHRTRCDVLHLHWPEAYFPKKKDGFDWFRRARFSTDLALATRRCALVVTAHNLHAHNRSGEAFARHNTGAAFRKAEAVIAHSQAARENIVENFDIAPSSVHVIPHGDLSVTISEPLPCSKARTSLGLGESEVCLMFGAIEPYKGIEEAIAFWKRTQPGAMLAIAGKPISEAYASQLSAAAAGTSLVHLHFGWLDDERLRRWLSAADCVLFNYREIFTSGAACLARSWGVPILLPTRLQTVALDEPHPLVFRFQSFDTDFRTQLRHALAAHPDYAAARKWRQTTAWPRVAEATASVYRLAAGARSTQ